MKKYFFVYLFFISSLFSFSSASKDGSLIDSILPTTINIEGINLILNSCEIEKEKDVVLSSCNISQKADLKKELDVFIGKELNMDSIQAIEQTIKKFLIKTNQLFYIVYAPSMQNVTDGIVVIRVYPAKVGKVESKCATYFSNEKIKDSFDVCEGQDLDYSKIKKQLTVFNANPFRNSEIIYSPGKEYGYTDLEIITEDTFPLRVYGGYNFTGYTVAGEARFFVGVNTGTIYYYDLELAYQYMFNPDVHKWQGHTASALFPLFKSTSLLLYGDYIKTNPDIALTSDGFSWVAAGKYYIPLVYKNLKSSFVIGYEFKRTNTFLNYISNVSNNNTVDISQFQFAYEGEVKDSYGKTAFRSYLYYSPGQWGADNTDSDFNMQRNGAKCDYIYSFITVDRITNLYKDIRWMFSFKGQIASAKLMPSEEFSIGGAHTVRGYKENILIGDRGLYVKNELRTPRVSFFPSKKDNFEFLAFLDYGYVSDVDSNIKDDDSLYIASAGAGIRYDIEEYLTARCDYGYPLKRALKSKDKEGRFHISIVMSY